MTVAAQHGLSYHSFFMRSLSIPLALALLVFQARPANNFALTIDNIMRGPALVGFEPSQVRLPGDSERIYSQWKQAGHHEEGRLAPPGCGGRAYDCRQPGSQKGNPVIGA